MTMESNYHQESINSSEENNYKGDELELNLDSSGLGRLYECVFCKRGFNTAQALGGHMNIHRKDRARNKPSTIITSNKKQELYHHISSSSSQNFNHEHVSDHDHDHGHHDHDDDHHNPHLMSTYATYFPPCSSSTTPLYEQEALNLLVPRDRCVSLSLGFSPGDFSMKSRVMNQKEELDLELRLGYDS